MKNILLRVLFVFVTTFSLSAHSALPSVESFFRDPAISDASLSPDGNFVAFISKAANGRQILIVSSTDNIKSLKAVAGFGGSDVVSAHWVNNNRLIFRIRNLTDDFARSNWSEYAVNRDGSELKLLISGDWEFEQTKTDSLIKSKILKPDYFYVKSLNDGSDDVIVGKASYNNIDANGNNLRLFRLNTKTVRLVDMLPGSQPDNVTAFWLDLNKEPRLTFALNQGRVKINYRDPKSNEWVQIEDQDYYSNQQFMPAFFDNNDSLYVISSYKGVNALYLYDLKQKKMQNEPFLNVDGFDFKGTPEIDFVNKKILGIHYVSDASNTVWLDPRFKAIQAKVDEILTQTINTINCGDCIPNHTVLVKSSSDHQPQQYFVYNPVTGAIFGLGGTHPEIKPEQMGSRDFYHFTARDGLSIPVYVTLPLGATGKPKPTVVLVHGGPEARGPAWEWDNEAQFLASRGYVVIQPEFRGSTGFGFDHTKKGWKNWGLTMQDDLADAANWAVAQGWADPKHIGIAGASYGGYATLMGLIKNPEIFRCGVEWAGVTDIGLMFDTPQDDASLEYLHYGIKTTVGDPILDAAQFKETSPLVNAQRLKQPIFMAYGGQDRRVPIVHGVEFRDAVRKTNKNVEWIQYANEAHGWDHEDNRIDFWKRVEAFLDKNLK